MDCLFCSIINKEIPSTKVYENETVYAFEDINPQAPVHILVVHKEHTVNINDTTPENAYIYADIFLAVKEIAALKGLPEKGYRVIVNNGAAAGQEVFHTHIHILGGADSLGPMLSK